MNAIVISAPNPYCIVPGDYFSGSYIKAEFTDIRKTFARFQHANPSHDDYDACDAAGYLEVQGAEKP